MKINIKDSIERNTDTLTNILWTKKFTSHIGISLFADELKPGDTIPVIAITKDDIREAVKKMVQAKILDKLENILIN